MNSKNPKRWPMGAGGRANRLNSELQPGPSRNASSLSRRHWISSSLAACSYLAASSLALGQSGGNPAPKGYTRPGPVTDRGRAPGLQTRVISENPSGEKTYALVFAKGDELLSGLTEFAARENLAAGYFTAIGALQEARFGWFDRAKKAYRNIPILEQAELISLVGNLALVNGAPQIHAHCGVGFRDGQMRGGHLLEATVWPTVELFFTAFPTSLIKKRDDETDLFLFDLKAKKDGSL
jgi:predicted DNA-binding protein with PD1-like motif